MRTKLLFGLLTTVLFTYAVPLHAQMGRSPYGGRTDVPFRDSEERPKSTKATGEERDGVYTETEVQHSWTSSYRPHETNSALQMAYADKLMAEGKTKAASKAYRSLTLTWPRSVHAAPAQQRYAKMLADSGELEDAFAAYEVLLDRYVGSFDYEEVVTAIFELGKTALNQRKGKFLGAGGWKAPERAIPMFESVLKNAPRWKGAAEAQYSIGLAHEMNDDRELAIVAYMSTENRYPGSAFAEKAAFGRTRLLDELATIQNPNDDESLDQAYSASVLFLQNYPRSENAVQVMAIRDALLARKAKAAYDRAAFYDKSYRKPSAALASYENFVRTYPNSEWVAVAQARITALRSTVKPASTP